MNKNTQVHILYTTPEICESCVQRYRWMDYQCACKCRYNDVYETTKCRYRPLFSKIKSRSGVQSMSDLRKNLF